MATFERITTQQKWPEEVWSWKALAAYAQWAQLIVLAMGKSRKQSSQVWSECRNSPFEIPPRAEGARRVAQGMDFLSLRLFWLMDKGQKDAYEGCAHHGATTSWSPRGDGHLAPREKTQRPWEDSWRVYSGQKAENEKRPEPTAKHTRPWVDHLSKEEPLWNKTDEVVWSRSPSLNAGRPKTFEGQRTRADSRGDRIFLHTVGTLELHLPKQETDQYVSRAEGTVWWKVQ